MKGIKEIKAKIHSNEVIVGAVREPPLQIPNPKILLFITIIPIIPSEFYSPLATRLSCLAAL